MPNYEVLMENLKKRGYEVTFFPTAEDAAKYLDKEIDGVSVGSGGSMTLQEMGLLERLGKHNTIASHWQGDPVAAAMTTPVYLSSVNGLAETGEIFNIDGTCNRVSSTLFGHDRVYLIVGKNKIAPDAAGALFRARNVASPKNAQRLGRKTPCAVKGDKCYDCDSPERICNALVTFWRKPKGIRKMEVVLIDEELGY